MKMVWNQAINKVTRMQSGGAKPCCAGEALTMTHSQSCIQNDTFMIMHSQSCIHNPSFSIMHSQSCVHYHAFTVTHSRSCAVMHSQSHMVQFMCLQLCSHHVTAHVFTIVQFSWGSDLALLEMRSQSVMVGCSLASLFSLPTSFPSRVSRKMSIVRPDSCPIELRLVST